ncbi:hypothetical protein FACS1894110_22810 [Spirochaetia bacterium]|nr:hypothetical protein FACS1894110_22810 [Spirochaetia bacterium]
MKLKKPKRQTVVVLGIVLLYIGLRFPFVYYDGEAIWTVCFEPLNEIFAGDIKGYILGRYTLETQYGDITIKPFCSFQAHDHRIDYISATDFYEGRAEHNLVFLENKIDEFASISFYYRNIERITVEQEFNLDKYSFGIEKIWVQCNISRANYGTITFTVSQFPERIILSDGSEVEIVKDTVGTREVGIVTDNWYFDLRPDGLWTMRGIRDSNYAIVKLPGETEGQRYTSITFEENWGNFVDGELPDGRSASEKSAEMLRKIEWGLEMYKKLNSID